MEETPKRVQGELHSIVPAEQGFRVRFVSWDPDDDGDERQMHEMLVSAEGGGVSMEPVGLLNECLEVMAMGSLEDLVSAKLRRMWMVGSLADEVMGTLAQSGLLGVFSSWSADSGDGDVPLGEQ